MPDETPAGYRPAGTVTITLHLAGGPVSFRGPLLLHETCGELVALRGVGEHERVAHPEAEEGRR